VCPRVEEKPHTPCVALHRGEGTLLKIARFYEDLGFWRSRNRLYVLSHNQLSIRRDFSYSHPRGYWITISRRRHPFTVRVFNCPRHHQAVPCVFDRISSSIDHRFLCLSCWEKIRNDAGSTSEIPQVDLTRKTFET